MIKLINMGRKAYTESPALISEKGKLVNDEAGLVVKFETYNKKKSDYVVLIPNDEIEKYIREQRK